MVSDVFPTVSVIIPTHNRSQLLKRAIGSVLNQTYSKLECIVVDDASTDETTEVVASFNDDRIRGFRHKINRHASAARNTGIKYSQGEYIGFLDDDDEWMPDKLKQQVDLLNISSPNIGLVYCWMSYIANGVMQKIYTPKLKGYIFKEMLDKQAIGNSSTLLVRKKVIDEIGCFDESLPRGNDGDFIRRVCRKYEVDFIPEVLVKVYTDHGNHRISDNNEADIRNAIMSQEHKLQKFEDELQSMTYIKATIYSIIGTHYVELGAWMKAIKKYCIALSINPKIIRLIMPEFIKNIKNSLFKFIKY
tara:strand:- start:147 stop:1058 length:912 start_codon:yes stop_codon:yes gene_type:complete